MKDKFTLNEVVALRSSLVACKLDRFQAAEMILAFVAEHGYGIGPETAREVACHVEQPACDLQILHMQLETQALAM
jgi:hypothetical protein